MLAECVTSLRYFFPILRVLKERQHDIKIVYPVDGAGLGKYNSAIRNLNVIADRIVKLHSKTELVPVASDSPKIKTDILFTVECVPRGLQGNIFEYDKKFCIQHGTDYTNFVQYADEKTTYIAHDKCYQDDLEGQFNINAIYPESPIAFWDIPQQFNFFKTTDRNDLLKKRIAYIFYPDKGHTALAKQVILYLHSLGFFVFVKQRRKHQAVEKFNLENVHILYDDMWYPSEAVIFSSIADIAIGFSSAAYADLIPAGVNYIDLALEPYSKCRSEIPDKSPWPGYIKPKEKNNFYYINHNSFKEIQETIDSILKTSSDKHKLKKFDNNLSIGEKFINDIL